MKHLALVCPEVSGHLNPMTALGNELRSRGHQVTFVGKEDGRAKVERAGLAFHVIGRDVFPEGSLAAFTAELGRLSGTAAVQRTVQLFTDFAHVLLRDLPDVLRTEQVDGVLVDQTARAAGTAAEAAGLPFVSVANALPLNVGPVAPPVMTTWSYRDTWWGRARNRLAYSKLRRMVEPSTHLVNDFRRAHELPPIGWLDGYSRLAQITQLPRCFDFPRADLPDSFHYTGPFHRPGSARDDGDFPWDRLDGRPLVYASMGTLQNQLGWVFEVIAEACAPLDIQLVMSLGGSTAALPEGLPGQPVVVPYAPQLQLLERAALVITHAGLNTALESLACGVPMVGIPVANDQPGVAARLRWTGAGDFVGLKKLRADQLRGTIQRVLSSDRHRAAARAIQQQMQQRDGLRDAADIVERAMA